MTLNILQRTNFSRKSMTTSFSLIAIHLISDIFWIIFAIQNIVCCQQIQSHAKSWALRLIFMNFTIWWMRWIGICRNQQWSVPVWWRKKRPIVITRASWNCYRRYRFFRFVVRWFVFPKKCIVLIHRQLRIGICSQPQCTFPVSRYRASDYEFGAESFHSHCDG